MNDTSELGSERTPRMKKLSKQGSKLLSTSFKQVGSFAHKVYRAAVDERHISLSVPKLPRYTKNNAARTSGRIEAVSVHSDDLEFEATGWTNDVHMEADENEPWGIKGLPDEWKNMLERSGISEDRIKANVNKAIAAIKFAAGKNDRIPLLTAQELEVKMEAAAPIEEKNPRTFCVKLKKIGEGASGVVFKVRKRENADIVAAKISDIEEMEFIKKEVAIHALSRHKNIVHYHECFYWEKEVWIIMDFVDGPALTMLLPMDDRLDLWIEENIAFVMKECLTGLNFMHRQNLLHRDIKSDNILVGIDATVKLADFGFAASLTIESRRRKTAAGTHYWMAPEVILQDEGYDEKCDIWSLGVTAIELVNKDPPHMGEDQLTTFFNILSMDPPRPYYPEAYTAEFNDFLEISLRKRFQERADTNLLLKHPFLNKVSTSAEFGEFVEEILGLND